MTSKIIKLDDIDISVKTCARSKHIKLRASSIIELIIPKGMSYNRAYEFALSKKLWIKTQSLKLSPLAKEFPHHISILGEEYKIILNDTNIKEPIKIIDQTLVISQVIPNEKINNIIHFFLKKMFRKAIEPIVEEKAHALNLSYNRISVKDTTSRWGSCSSSGNLSFSWRLILAPKQVMEYVIIHEVAHLKEMNHSYKFWQLVKQLMPDYQTHRAWLKLHGKNLHTL